MARHLRPPAHRSWPQRAAVGFGVLLSVLCLLAATAVGYVYWKSGSFARAHVTLDDPVISDGPSNYLIIGSDSREGISKNDPGAGAFLGDGTEVPAGKRSDTILLLRIDPSVRRIDMISFPRDLWVPIAGTNHNGKINTAYGEGRQRLIDTVRQYFDVPVNHYIEVDFKGFERLVNALGGVNMYFSAPVRDTFTGLTVSAPGCAHLDGTQALAFARSRHYSVRQRSGFYREDPTSDLGRIKRQQTLIRQAAHKAVQTDITDLLVLNRLLDVAVESVTIDAKITRSDLIGLAKKFKDTVDSDIVTHSLPVTIGMSADGQSILRTDVRQDRSVLDLFRGRPAGELLESDVSVRVLNGTGVPQQATEVQAALSAVGFTAAGVGDAHGAAVTTIRYAPASAAAADLLARHLTSPVTLSPDTSLAPDELVLTTGPDFTTVRQNARPATATTTTSSTVPVTTSTTAPVITTTTPTTLDPYQPGVAPAGESCEG